MAGVHIPTYPILIKYIDETLAGVGALKGAPCTIKSITHTTRDGFEGNLVTYEYEDKNGVKYTETMFVKDGLDGDSIGQWTSGKDYKVNDVVIKNDKLYYCKVANHDSSFDESKWQLLGGETEVLFGYYKNGKFYQDSTYQTEYPKKQNTLYVDMQGKATYFYNGTSFVQIGGGSTISNWTAYTSYAVGDLVIKDAKIYQCAIANSDGTFIPSKWIAIGSADGNFSILDNDEFDEEHASDYLPSGYGSDDRKMVWVVQTGTFWLWDGTRWVEQLLKTITNAEIDELF